MVSKYLPYIIIAAVVIAGIVILGVLTGSSKANLAEAIDNYNKLEKAKELLIKEKLETIAGLENKIAEFGHEVTVKKQTILNLETTIRENNIALDELREAEPEGEETPLVINLRSQLVLMTENFSICKKQGAGWYSITFLITGKYKAQLKITENIQDMYQLEQKSHNASRLVVTEYARRLKLLRVENALLKSALLVGVIVAAYLLFK